MVRPVLGFRLALASLLVLSACPAPPQSATKDAAPPLAASLDAGTAPDASPSPDAPLVLGSTPSTLSWRDDDEREPSDVCEPARKNLERASAAIRRADRRGEAAASDRPWNHVERPRFADLVEKRFGLTAAEKQRLARNGFVVPARLETEGYGFSLHEIYQSQLPLYVSVDAVLHSVFKTHDAVLERTEDALSAPLGEALERMHEGLVGASSGWPADTARDVDLYLTVARSLLGYDEVASRLGVDAEVKPIVERARSASGGLSTIRLFGRDRVIDFSAYQPRGHYTHSEDMGRWFQASMWLSRLELNLVSRASRSSQPGVTPNPEETPREAVMALALSELAQRTGALAVTDRIEKMMQGFAGRREDVSLRDLLALRGKAEIASLNDPQAAAKLKAAIGSGFQRTARIHYMPQGSNPLPVIATMLGPRVVADAPAISNLVHAPVDGRSRPSFADVGFLLGHPRARAWLEPEIARHPRLLPMLEEGRRTLGAIGDADLYGAWLKAVLALSPEVDSSAGSVTPSYQRTPAFADLRFNSAFTAFGQIKHNHVLLAGQPYLEGGCEIPDAFLEPALATYQALGVYAARGRALMAELGNAEDGRYFERLETITGVLATIARDERAGLPLSDDEKRWLSMIVEIVPPTSEGPGRFDGWYFDLFTSVDDAFADSAFLADWFTASDIDAVVYAGAGRPRLGLFVVDTGGPPRLMVGPVARGFEHVGSLAKRLSDDAASTLGKVVEPWAASYRTAAPPTPPIHVTTIASADGGPAFAIRGARSVGAARFELLGHHRDVLATRRVEIGARYRPVRFPPQEGAERARLVVGDFRAEISIYEANDGFGGVPALEWEELERVREGLERTGPDVSPSPVRGGSSM